MRPLPAWDDRPLSWGGDGRAAPRLEVETVLTGCLVRGTLRMTVHDLGFGGFSVEAPLAFAVGSQHDFRFIGPEGMVVEIRAETVYSRAVGLREGMDHHLTGFKYLVDSDETKHVVDLLIDAALSPISFE